MVTTDLDNFVNVQPAPISYCYRGVAASNEMVITERRPSPQMNLCGCYYYGAVKKSDEQFVTALKPDGAQGITLRIFAGCWWRSMNDGGTVVFKPVVFWWVVLTHLTTVDCH